MLILDIQDLQQAVPVSDSLVFERVRPYLKNAQALYLAPVMGRDLLAELAEAREAEPSELQAELIEHLQFALGNLAMMDFAPVNLAVVGESGTVEVNTEGAQRAAQWVTREQMAGYIANGFRRLEEAIRFLEENLTEFSAWETSQYFTIGRQRIIPNALVFDEFYKIGESGWLYLQLLPQLRQMESYMSSNLLGANFLQEIRTWIAAGEENQTAEQMEVIRMLRSALAYLTIARSLNRLAVNIGTEGITLSLTNTTQSVKAIQPATREEKADLIREAEQSGNQFRQELAEYLKANADTFPTWKASPFYRPESAVFKNDPVDPVAFFG